MGVSDKPRGHHLKCLLIVRQESGSYFAAERLEMPENDVEFCRSWEDAKNFPNSYFPSLIDALSLMHSHNSHIHTLTHTHTHTHTHSHTHTYIYTHTHHTHTHTNIHTHTTHSHKNTHAHIGVGCGPSGPSIEGLSCQAVHLCCAFRDRKIEKKNEVGKEK